MATNLSVLDLDIKTVVDDNDSVVMTVNGIVSRVKISTLKSLLKQWNDILNKPFESIDVDVFEIRDNFLSLAPDILNDLHSHQNKTILDKIGETNEGEMTYDGNVISSDWNNVVDKPFLELSSDFTVTDNILFMSTDVKHTHTNKTVIDKFSENEGTLLYDGQEIGSGSGLDFATLSDALTGGTLTGINIVADSETETFNITVRDMPTIGIDANGDWTINGVSIGQSSKGEDGATPTINESDKHWYINGVDTNVVAEGQDGQNGLTPTIDVTTKHWIIGETDTGVLAEGQSGNNGVTPSIDVETKHWMIGEDDTNIVAEGQNGFSPSIILSENTNGVDITIVNEDSTQTTTITNGITTLQTEKIDLTCTILAGNWSNTVPYTQTVTVNGVTEELNPRIDILISDDIETGNSELQAWAYVTKAITSDNSVTFYCYNNKPEIDLNVMIEVI